jgi:hypothetical protein
LKHGCDGGLHISILSLRFHLIAPSACKGSCPTGTTVREFSRTLNSIDAAGLVGF